MTHDEFHNLTQAYLAGGLAGDERAAMDAHGAECPACAASLEQAQAADRELQDAFAADVPDERLEDRVIAAIRQSRGPRPIAHPLVRRAAVGVAAAILLGGVGFAVTRPDREQRIKDATNLRQIGLAVQAYSSENKGDFPRTYFDELAGGVPSTQPGVTRWSRGTNENKLPKLTLESELSRSTSDGPALAKELKGTNSKKDNLWWDADHDFAFKSTPHSDSVMRSDDFGLRVSNGDSTAYYTQLGDGVTTGTKAAEAGDKPQADSKVAGKPGEVRFKPDAAFGTTPLSTFDIAGKRIEGLEQRAKRPQGQSEGEGRLAEALNAPTFGENGRGLDKSGRGRLALGVVANGTLDVGGGGQGGGQSAGQGQQQPQQQGQQGQDSQGLGRRPAVSAGTVVFQDGHVDQLARAGDADGKQADKPAAGQASVPAPAKSESPKPEAPKPAAAANDALAGRKVIRNGEMTFVVDGYDSAVVQINKIAAEEGGFVATTESEKLPNGKVKGSVVVRVPPDRLDTLVLKLRGLGDLKNSRVSAQDITKQYTDLDAQLRAAKTMEQRLLEIIKSGKGEVKDLIEAEKQLGSWREKIEKLEGEIRYYNNLVALSTLTVTLAERDVRAASLLSETEQVQMGVEADDVEKARAAALKAIEEAKGRVIASDLKKHAAGQFAATITADLAPDQAGPAIDRLKQLGRVARLEAQRQQKTAEGSGTPIPGARIERKDTRLTLSIYNLANVAARNTTTLQLAAEDVESAYGAILGQIESAGGRVVNSQLSKPTPEQTTGTIAFESPTAAADVLLGAVRGAGDVLRLDTAINPDADNTTAAKRGFSVTIQAAATVAPAESVSLRLAVDDVSEKFEKLVGALRGVKGARVTQSSVNQQTPTNTVGQIEVDVRGAEPRAAVERALADAGAVYLRSVSHASPGQTVLADKAHVSVLLGDVDAIPPRETTTVAVETADVTGAAGSIEAAAVAAGGRKVDSDWSQQPGGQTVAKIVVDVPQSQAAEIIKKATDARRVISIQREQTPNVPEGPFARSRLSVSFSTVDTIQGDQTLGGSVRSGLATSVQWLLRSVTWIVVGLCLVAPWALVIWAISRMVKRRKRREDLMETPPPPNAPSAATAT
jgi:hypothetical protein